MRAHRWCGRADGDDPRQSRRGFPDFRAILSDETSEAVSAVVIATGFEPFDPSDLEEYGYSRYPNVVTAP